MKRRAVLAWRIATAALEEMVWSMPIAYKRVNLYISRKPKTGRQLGPNGPGSIILTWQDLDALAPGIVRPVRVAALVPFGSARSDHRFAAQGT